VWGEEGLEGREDKILQKSSDFSDLFVHNLASVAAILKLASKHTFQTHSKKTWGARSPRGPRPLAGFRRGARERGIGEARKSYGWDRGWA